MRRLVPLVALLVPSAAAAPVKIVFWHSMGGAAPQVQRLADEFNRTNTRYEVLPQAVGNYREAEGRLRQALKAGNAPALFQVELSAFPAFVADGTALPLPTFEKALSPKAVRDFWPVVWQAGQVNGARYGMPWNVSTPALYFNAGALRREGVSVPRTWAELDAAARKLSAGGRRSYLSVTDWWTFEAVVTAHGGTLVQGGQPNFTSPEVVRSLELLAGIVSSGAGAGRSVDEAARSAFDFVRGQHVMALASVTNWPDFQKLALLFELGAAPVPCAQSCAVPLGGANLIVVRGADAEQTAGAQAFWRFLMEPDRLAAWVRETSYLPPRRSVQPLLTDWLALSPYRPAVFAQLDRAVPRPPAPEFVTWRAHLETALERALKGGVPPREALQEAQRRALADQP